MPRQAFFLLLALLIPGALLTAAPVAAQDAETFFHQAAQSYIGKDVPEAKRQVEAGLRVAPSDPKLLALQKKLEQQEQQQSGPSGQGQPQNAPQQDQEQKQQAGSQSGEQQDDQQEEGNQEADEESEQPPDEQSPPNDPPQGEQESADDASEGQPGEAQRPPSPDPSTTLTEAQAERLLQALQNQEKQLLREVQRGRPARGRPTDKDW